MAGETKERILEAALELFAQSGYSGTSMNDIAKQMGITKGALYKHYTGKQEILDRIVERIESDWIMSGRKSTRCPGDGAGWFRGGVSSHADRDDPFI